MKHKSLFLTFLSAGALVIGCDQQNSTSKQLDKVQIKASAAADDMKDYTFAQKAEFTAKMQSQLADINKDLDTLQAKIDKSSDSVKAECAPKLQVLRDQQSALSKQLDQVKDASESTWDSVKAGTSKAYASLKEGFQQSRQWISDKIAP
jgi:capsule polysaccharide export protein KpsE/RkpR